VEVVVADRTVVTTVAGENGRYSVAVPQGVRYELRVRLQGFADYVADMQGTTAPASRDVVLQVGGVSDTLIVTASRGLERRATVTQSVSVMTAADIEALGSASLADVLRHVPAVNLESTGREVALTGMFTRGGTANYNLVLIDGVRVNQNGGSFDFSRISAAEIDRVEIVRGAQSSLWGSDAIGSVVQVFTKRAGAGDAPQLSGSVEGGTFNTRRAQTRIAGGVGGQMDYHANVTHRGTDGAFSDILSENDWFEQTTFDGGFGTTLGTRASLRTGVRIGHAQGRSVGPIVYGARNTGSSYDTRDVTWHLTSTHSLGGRFTGTATFNYYRFRGVSADRVGDPPYTTFAVLEGTPGALFPDGARLVRTVDEGEFAALAGAGALPAPGQFLASGMSFNFPFESETEFRRPALRYQGDYTWAPGQRLSAGYEWERESNPLEPGRQLDNNAFFVQQQFGFAQRWFVTVGARTDYKENFDTYVSPKLSAGGFLLPVRPGAVSSVRVFGNVGRGIKAPFFYERLGAPWADPNPDLRVEQARTADLGVEATFVDQHLRASATYFDNRYRDQIAFRFGTVGDGIPEYININGSKADGWELELALQRPVAGFTAFGSYALVDTAVVSNISTSQQFQPGQPLLRRPKHSGAMRVGYAAGAAAVHFDVRFVGQRHDSAFLFLNTVPNAERPDSVSTDITVNPGYAVAGLGVDVRAHEAFTVFVRGDNLGDTSYQSALGYPGLPRSVMAGVRFNVGRR
jgi:vitamin B12 transporter